jgi:elongation factor Ts
MTNVSASEVMKLRQMTGAAMMDCKKYLIEAKGDIDKAIENMRKLGAIKAAKRADNITKEGVIAIQITVDGKKAVMLEVNSETDFVSRGEEFKKFAILAAQTALQKGEKDVEALKNLELADGNTLENTRQLLIAKIGENINLRRLELLESPGFVTSYVHGDRIGVLVSMEGGDVQLGKDIAMHIAASNPMVVNPEEVSAELIAKEREIFADQAQKSGKPQEIIDKMIDGRIQKYLDEVSLMGQPFVKDPNKKVSDVLKAANAKVLRFIRYEVGEGIEKQEQNFAAEVMAQVRGS